MKHNNNNNNNNRNNNNSNQLKRIYVLPSGTLSLNDIRRTDAGIYQCIATNTEGSETLEIQLSVMEALTVQILPTQQTVDLGKSTDLVRILIKTEKGRQKKNANIFRDEKMNGFSWI